MFWNRKKKAQLDQQAARLAEKYGMLYEYKEARSYGASPIEALEDWDLPINELYDERR